MKLLIIAFKFPPYGGVGSFRWSKFTKYLAKSENKVNVLTIKWKNILMQPDEVSWQIWLIK